MNLEKLNGHFDTYSDEVKENWLEVNTHMRENCPVSYSDIYDGVWFVSRYEDVHRVMRESKTFSTQCGTLLPPGLNGLIPAELEGDELREFRKAMDPFMSAASVLRYEPAIRKAVRNSIATFVNGDGCDAIGEFTRRFPGVVIFTAFLGIEDPQELEECLRHADGVAYELNSDVGSSAGNDLEEWCSEFIENRRKSGSKDDILDAMISADICGRSLCDEEVMQALKMFILAGLDTTTSTLGNALLHLAQDLGLQRRLRNEPEILPQAIEELLRYDAVVTSNSRLVTRDIEIGGTHIKSGSTIAVLHAAANRDPRAFDNPEHIDITRKRKLHFTFGAGPHLCMGIHLARLEMRVALEEFLQQLPEFRLDGEKTPSYKQGVARGLENLNVLFDRH